MAVIACVEAKDHATLKLSLDGKDEWTAPYLITVDSPRDDAMTVANYLTSIGRGLGTTFVYGDREDPYVVCKTITPTRISNSATHWQAILSYSPMDEEDENNDDEGNQSDDPEEWRYDISCGIQYYQVPVWKAWNVDQMPYGGAGGGYVRAAESLGPVINSAGIVYDPPLMREIPETVLRVTGNLLDFRGQDLTQFPGHINQFALRWHSKLTGSYNFLAQTFDPYCVLCNGITASFQRAKYYDYWQYTCEIKIRQRADALNPQDGFLESVLDRGITRIANSGAPDGAGGTISPSDIETGMAVASPIKDWQGDRVPELMLLDGHGQPLQGCNTVGAPPVYFRWRIHPYADFTDRSFPLMIFAT
jgi:hypothetical protein